jgi:hypothetical protein
MNRTTTSANAILLQHIAPWESRPHFTGLLNKNRKSRVWISVPYKAGNGLPAKRIRPNE